MNHDTDHPTTWHDTLWNELEQLPSVDQFVTSGEWITYITQDLLPALARHRRQTVLAMLDEPDATGTSVAAAMGSRRSTILRLASEGRNDLKLDYAEARVAQAAAA